MLTLSLLATGLLVTAGTNPSHAEAGLTLIPCPAETAFAGFLPGGGGGLYYHTEVVSSTPVFDVAFGRVLENNTDEAATESITIQTQRVESTRVTRTYERTTADSSGGFFGRLVSGFANVFRAALGAETESNPSGFTETIRNGVSTEIVNSVTTSLGVTIDDISVQPHTEVLFQYGVDAYDIELNNQVFIRLDGDPSKCWSSPDYPDFGATVHAPTVNERGRLTVIRFPTITNVVNPAAGMTEMDIQPGSVVTINGSDFYPPGDVVQVKQAGRTWEIKAGSPFWDDFESRITAQLPSELRIGPAEIRVVSDGRISQKATVEIVAQRPRISPDGVVKVRGPRERAWTSENITAGSHVAIFGDRFTPGSDKVEIAQGGQVFTVQAGTPLWYDGPAQINLTMPDGLVPGEAEVRVVNIHGSASDAATITIVDPRPRVTQVVNPTVPAGQPWTTERIQPGTPVSIYGDLFRPGEDKVVITQGDEDPWLVQAGSPYWYDSAGQINLLLPADLQAGEAQVYVRHNKGLSDPVTINVVDVAPQIAPNGVLNPAAEDPFGRWTANDIRRGTVVAIFGDYFTPAPGDKVRVTQEGVGDWTVERGSPGWYDSVNQINAAIPAGVQPGPAEVRVVNVNGRESEPANITIVP